MALTAPTDNLVTDPKLLNTVQEQVLRRLSEVAGSRWENSPTLARLKLRAIRKDRRLFTFSLPASGASEPFPAELAAALRGAIQELFNMPTAQLELTGAGPLHAGESSASRAAAEQAWQAARAQLRRDLPRPTFASYLEDAALVAFDDESGQMTLGAADAYARDWLQDRLTSILAHLLTGILNRAIDVRFVVNPTGSPAADPADLPLEALAADPAVSPAGGRTGDHAPRLAVAAAETLPVAAESQPPAAIPDSQAVFHLLETAQPGLREAFIDKNQIVSFPAYLLRWIPFVGTTPVALAIAFRQARYLAAGCSLNGKNAAEPFSVTARDVYRWAGVSRATFFRLVDSPAMRWFIRKVAAASRWIVDEENGSVRQPPNVYQFTAYAPLTPLDARDLADFLVEAGVPADPLAVLSKLASKIQPREVWRYPPPSPEGPPAAPAPQIETVHSVVLRVAWAAGRPEALGEIAALADKIEDRLVGGNVQLSWYFWANLMPRLKDAAGMLVVYLRSLGFHNRKTGEANDEVWIEGGAEEIARLLALSDVRNLARWFPPLTSRGQRRKDPAEARPATQVNHAYDQAKRDLIGRFLTRQEIRPNPAGCYDWKIKVEFSDPLTPEHQTAYDDLCRAIAALVRACLTHDLEAAQVIDLIETTRQVSGWAGAAQGSRHQNDKLRRLPRSKNDKMSLPPRPENDKTRRSTGDPNDKKRLAAWLENDNLSALNDQLRLVTRDENDNLRLTDPNLNDNSRPFKVIKVLNTIQEVLSKLPAASENSLGESNMRWVGGSFPDQSWDLQALIEDNVVSPDHRQRLSSLEDGNARAFVSWLIHCASPARGKGVVNSVGVAVKSLEKNPGVGAGGACDRLADLPPEQLLRLLLAEINREKPWDLPGVLDWQAVMGGASRAQLVNLADRLGLPIQAAVSSAES